MYIYPEQRGESGICQCNHCVRLGRGIKGAEKFCRYIKCNLAKVPGKGGKGFADLVFLPRKRFPDKPALVVELKWDKSAAGAIQQIKEKEYCKSLEGYRGNILLVGINYDKKTREHECEIEELIK